MKTKRPVLVIIAGPNGSGKTTITEQLLKHEWGSDCVYINPDNIATEQRYKLLEEGRNLAFETVLSSEEKVDFVRKAKSAGYFIRLFYISTTSPSINAARVTNRFIEGGHSVPIDKIVSRYTKSIVNCSRILKLVDRIYVYDNSVENQMASLLFRVSEGKLSKQYVADIPLWARPLLKLSL